MTLPAGVTVSPAAAQGLAGCQSVGPQGINLGSDEIGELGQDLGDPQATELGAGHAGGNDSPYDDGIYHLAHGHCPDSSKLGTAEVFTPLLSLRCGGEGQSACAPGESSAPLQGSVYLAQPRCGGVAQPACTEASATNGELYGLYVEVEGAGVIVKLPGTVSANPQSGQLRATFRDNPQLPFSELRLHFHGGPRAPLANPQSCGTFASSSVLSSWAGQEVVAPGAAFAISQDGQGAPCPATPAFAPGFSAGTTTPVAGAPSPFAMTVTRSDREQNLTGLSITLPQGLLAKVAGVPQCADVQAASGTCGAESQIGNASVQAGAGERPLYVPGGRVYLTGPYEGAPFGLSIVVPAVAGPFNLGNVVVRGAIHIDPSTAAATVQSDPLPTARDGVPFRLRAIHVEINRPGGFTINPTGCAQQSVVATIAGSAGTSATVSSPFSVAGCSALAFKPRFTAATRRKTSKLGGASLTVKVTQTAGEAGIHKALLQIPTTLPARLATLNGACRDTQFLANPAGCPARSVIGTATVRTPILNAPLTGPALLVSHGNAAFPDVEFVLQGEGVEIVLDGKTEIKKGITYSRFETVPDAPISSFETVLPEGPHSIIAANGDLCRQNLVMPTTLVGQNGATLNQNTRIQVEGCPRALRVISRSVSRRTLELSVYAPAASRLTASGKGVGGASKSSSGSEAVRLTLHATRAGRFSTTVRLSFRLAASGVAPRRRGALQRKTMRVTFAK